MHETCSDKNLKHFIGLSEVDCAMCTFEDRDTLLNACLEHIVDNITIICDLDSNGHIFHLKYGIVLPMELCDKLLNVMLKRKPSLSQSYIEIFDNLKATRLQKVDLSAVSVSRKNMQTLSKHQLTQLSVRNSCEVNEYLFEYLNRSNQNNLCRLSISGIAPNMKRSRFEELIAEMQEKSHSLSNLSKLTSLTISDTNYFNFDLLLRPLKQLVSLNLSMVFNAPNRLEFLPELENLEVLILHDFKYVGLALDNICAVKSLKFLDISLSEKERDMHGVTMYKATETLTRIAEDLPNLTSLDISCTSYAGTGVAQQGNPHDSYCDIAGLDARTSNPFKFLGLYRCHFSPCRRHHIPAEMVSGDATEQQLLIAAYHYMNRPDYLQQILNDLYRMLRYSSFYNIGQALTLILKAMETHLDRRAIQIATSATLFYVLRSRTKEDNGLSSVLKKTIIRNLVNGMMRHRNDVTIMRNGCLNLCQFHIPYDFVFECERLVIVLMDSMIDHEEDGFVNRLVIYLLNSLSCQVVGEQKIRLGTLGIIKRMIDVIAKKLEEEICDDVLEVAWSALWNITDETPVNCCLFLDNDGLTYFSRCLEVYPEKDELVRNMMGLLGNVAEVQSLRHRLMSRCLIEAFTNLLFKGDEGIEVSYNAAGVLAHLASDGADAWHIEQPPRLYVLMKLELAITGWNIRSERNINYRSFEPILKLTKVDHTMECQLWAVWALANLTTVYPLKYCPLLISENGLEYIERLYDRLDKRDCPIVDLSNLIIKNCKTFESS